MERQILTQNWLKSPVRLMRLLEIAGGKLLNEGKAYPSNPHQPPHQLKCTRARRPAHIDGAIGVDAEVEGAVGIVIEVDVAADRAGDQAAFPTAAAGFDHVVEADRLG